MKLSDDIDTDLTQQAVEYVKSACSKAGVFYDTYDADFVVGVVMDFCSRNDAAFTGAGCRRLR